ncbi:MAG: hypothetical protein COY53_06310 [Elusimicrobia bacterium CG_4_10_14_0_8_um_filter_37_32]|nr:MAG: hypothetical protein COY53_06310 [Elusimicrobia bacterium CG_4_10_14_0_8_um_filter_37_32]
MRLFRFLIIILFISVLQIGCTKNQKDYYNTDFITLHVSIIGLHYEIEVTKEIARNFEKENPGIKIYVEPITGTAYETKLMVLSAGGNPPDIIWLADVTLPDFASKGMLACLDDFVKKDKEFNLEDYYPQILEICKYKKKLYYLPREFASVVMYYNKTLFDKSGVEYPTNEWTWTEFYEKVKKLTKDINGDGIMDQIGYVADLGWQAVRNSWLWQAGGSVYNDAFTECTINTKESKEAIEFLAKLVKEKNIFLGAGHAQLETFMTGKAAMMSQVRSVVPSLRHIKDFEWDVVSLPKFRKKVTLLGTCGYGISLTTKHPEEAWKFLKYTAGPKGQTLLCKLGSIVPSIKSIAESDTFLKSVPPRHNNVYLESIKYGRMVPILKKYSELEDKINTKLSSVFIGERDAKKVCEEIKKEIDLILRKNMEEDEQK